jgi:hypothetical protein
MLASLYIYSKTKFGRTLLCPSKTEQNIDRNTPEQALTPDFCPKIIEPNATVRKELLAASLPHLAESKAHKK